MAPARAKSGPRSARRRGLEGRGVSTKASTGGLRSSLLARDGPRAASLRWARNEPGLCLRCTGRRSRLLFGHPSLDLAVARPVRARQDRLSSLRAFRHPNFVRFWLGAFISNVGTWMETIGVGVYVTQATGRAGWTGTVAALMYLPTLVLGPLAGALADRIDRRRLLSVLTTAQTLLAAVLAVLAFTDRLSVPVVALLAFGAGCVNALVSPVYSSLLAELVPAEDLLSALSLSSAQYNLGRIIGPSLAAIAMAAGGLALAFLCNAASFVAVLVSLMMVQLPPRAEHDGHGDLWGEIRTGFRVAREDAGIRT